MSQSARIALDLSVRQSNNLDLSEVSQGITYKKDLQYTDGTGADQANANFSDQRSIAASGTDAVDLFGAVQDAFGTTLNFTRVNAIMIFAHADNGGNLEVSSELGGLFAASTDVVTLHPGGLFAITAPDATGYPVTDSTGDDINVANLDTGAAANYDIVVIGSV